jgi:GGDEF domain-containing protein
MNKYVVAYLSFFDNEINQKVVSASSPTKAIAAYLELTKTVNRSYIEEVLERILDDEDGGYEAIRQWLFDMDSAVTAIEI